MGAAEQPFTLLVSLVGGRATPYTFNQERVLVGRGLDADLRIEHAGIARAQFLLERGLGSAGEARFRITPYETTNPTYVNERPAVEGTLTPGDLIAVCDVRISLPRKMPRPEAVAKKKDQIPPMRALLLTAMVGMALWVGWLWFGGSGGEPDAGDLASPQTKLFFEPPEVRCGNPVECDTRAHDAYARGKKLVAQSSADPGNLYRAALELDRASKFREQSGRPLADIADVGAQAEAARTRAEAEWKDAKFRLSRAIAASDLRRCSSEAALLARIVPDDRHPYRVKLDAYRRGLPKPEAPTPGESK